MCAAHLFYELSKQEKPKTTVILGPDHTGLGGVLSSASDDWVTPLGVAKLDRDSLRTLGLEADDRAHAFEHSIEVQLPFLQYIWDDFKFLPIMISAPGVAGGLGVESSIADLEDALVIASSDFTHYESADSAKEKDDKAIEAILDLDEQRFLEVVEGYRATICGYAPIVSTIIIAKKMGAKKAELLKYTTSGDVTGDYSSVVAYASIVFKK
jgi:AmmeMemoRadiSam system protein B